jgi:hypothetical protein
MRQLRADNEQRIVALVRENPGSLSVDAAALRLLISPITIRSAVKRGVVDLRDHRLFPS